MLLDDDEAAVVAEDAAAAAAAAAAAVFLLDLVDIFVVKEVAVRWPLSLSLSCVESPVTRRVSRLKSRTLSRHRGPEKRGKEHRTRTYWRIVAESVSTSVRARVVLFVIGYTPRTPRS